MIWLGFLIGIPLGAGLMWLVIMLLLARAWNL